jgi:hypothetical protein
VEQGLSVFKKVLSIIENSRVRTIGYDITFRITFKQSGRKKYQPPVTTHMRNVYRSGEMVACPSRWPRRSSRQGGAALLTD